MQLPDHIVPLTESVRTLYDTPEQSVRSQVGVQ